MHSMCWELRAEPSLPECSSSFPKHVPWLVFYTKILPLHAPSSRWTVGLGTPLYVDLYVGFQVVCLCSLWPLWRDNRLVASVERRKGVRKEARMHWLLAALCDSSKKSTPAILDLYTFPFEACQISIFKSNKFFTKFLWHILSALITCRTQVRKA